MTDQDLQELKKCYLELGQALDRQFDLSMTGISLEQLKLVRQTSRHISRARSEIALIADMTMEEICLPN